MGYANVVRILRAYPCRISQEKDYQCTTRTTTHHVAKPRVTGRQNVASTEIGAPVSRCDQERPSEISALTCNCSVGYQPGELEVAIFII